MKLLKYVIWLKRAKLCDSIHRNTSKYVSTLMYSSFYVTLNVKKSQNIILLVRVKLWDSSLKISIIKLVFEIASSMKAPTGTLRCLCGMPSPVPQPLTALTSDYPSFPSVAPSDGRRGLANPPPPLLVAPISPPHTHRNVHHPSCVLLLLPYSALD